MGGRNPTRAKRNQQQQQQQGKRRIEQGREKRVFWWDCAKNGVCRCWWVGGDGGFEWKDRVSNLCLTGVVYDFDSGGDDAHG
jgi:hypothetical protein